MVPMGEKLSQELQGAVTALVNATQANDQVKLELRTEAGNDRGIWQEIDQEHYAEKNATAFAAFMNKRETTLQKSVENVSDISHRSLLRVSQFSVKLRGIIAGLDVGDKFAEQTFVDAETDLAKAHTRNARASKMTLRAARLINGTNLWLERTKRAEELVKNQTSKDRTAQKKLQEDAQRLEAEAKADSKILRGLVKENFDDFGAGTGNGKGVAPKDNTSRPDPLDGSQAMTPRRAPGTRPAPLPARPDKLGDADRPDKLDEADRPDKQDEADRPDKLDEADQPDKLDEAGEGEGEGEGQADKLDEADQADLADQSNETDQALTGLPAPPRNSPAFGTPVYGEGQPEQAEEADPPPAAPSPLPPRQKPFGTAIYGSGSLAAGPTAGAINILASPRSKADPWDLGAAPPPDDDAELYRDLRSSSGAQPKDMLDPVPTSGGQDDASYDESPADLRSGDVGSRGVDQDDAGVDAPDQVDGTQGFLRGGAYQADDQELPAGDASEAPRDGREVPGLQPESDSDLQAARSEDDYPRRPAPRGLRSHGRFDTAAFQNFGPLAREINAPLGSDGADSVAQDAPEADEADEEAGSFDADADRA